MSYVALETLAPGARFRTESGTTGTLIYANALRARVRLDGKRSVRITDADSGTTTEFEAPASAVDIAPRTMVEEVAC